MCRCALTASLRATRGQPRKNQTDDIRMSNSARRYPPSVYPNRYTVGRYQAGTADSWSYPPVVRRSGCMAGRYVCGIVNRRRYLPPLCDGPVAWRADGSLVSCGFRCYPPVVRRSGHTTSRYLAYLAGRSPSPAVTRWPSPTDRQPLTVSATAPSAWPYVRWCRNWTAKHRLPLLPVRVCPVLPTPRVSDVRFLHYRR